MDRMDRTMNAFLLKKKVEMLALLFIVVGALNWGLVGLFDFNLVSYMAQHTFTSLEKIVYVSVGLGAIIHIINRNYYLPFLGDAVFPCNSMVEKVPERADTQVSVFVRPNSNVIYWAAEEHDKVVENPWLAYAEYSNAGVSKAGANGIAVLRFRRPAAYRIKRGWKHIAPHVHYRVCTHPGMLSEVKTVTVDTS